MTTVSALSIVAGRSLPWLAPERVLALAITLIALAGGCFTPLYFLGVFNLLFGQPAVTSAAVISWSCVGTCFAIVMLKWNAMIQMDASSFRHKSGTSIGISLCILVAAVLYALLFFDSLLSFPNGYDPIMYHIDVALKWLQNGTFRIDPTWGWRYALPSNGELQTLLALSVGLPKFVAGGNLLAAILLAISAYLIAWKLTGERDPSLITVAIVITIPMIIYQAFQLCVDLFGSAFLMSAAALILWRDKALGPCILLSGYAAGVAIGSKPVFWAYGAIFLIAAGVAIMKSTPSRFKNVMILIFGALLSSGFWFLRAAWSTGNPVYPMQVVFGDWELFAGYARTEITLPSYGIESLGILLALPWSESVADNWLPVGFDRGTGPLFAAIALPGILFLVVQTIRSRISVLEFQLLLISVVGALVWAATMLRVPRFAMPIIILSCLLSAPMLQDLLRAGRRSLIALSIVGVILNALSCLAEPAQRAFYRVRLGDFSRATYYGYPPLVDELPDGSRIIDLTEGRRSSFLLAGASLTNYVVPNRDLQMWRYGAEYIVKDGPPDSEDASILSRGATLVYDGVPATLYPKTARTWRVYRVH